MKGDQRAPFGGTQQNRGAIPSKKKKKRMKKKKKEIMVLIVKNGKM